MKKLKITVSILAGLFISYCFFCNDCDVLPEDVNYKIILDAELYTLTPSGLIEEGSIIDYEKLVQLSSGFSSILDWPQTYYTRLNKSQKTIYFAGGTTGVSKLDLTNNETVSVFIPNAKKGTSIAISPDENLLLFAYHNNYLWVLHLKTGEKTKLLDDFTNNYGQVPVWVNNHQFFYENDKHQLICFDIDSLTSTNLNVDGFRLGEVSPDGNEILLSGRERTILYNLTDHSSTVIMNYAIRPSCMIWLPNKKGFLYLHDKLMSVALNYYSIEKRKSIRLMNHFTESVPASGITTGFFVPPDIEIKPVDIKRNRERPLPFEYKIVKTCTSKLCNKPRLCRYKKFVDELIIIAKTLKLKLVYRGSGYKI